MAQFQTILLFGTPEKDGLLLATAAADGLAVEIIVADFLGGAGNHIRLAFDPSSTREATGDVFLYPVDVAGEAIVFLLARGQSLYVGGELGTTTVISYQTYQIDTAEIPYLT